MIAEHVTDTLVKLDTETGRSNAFLVIGLEDAGFSLVGPLRHLGVCVPGCPCGADRGVIEASRTAALGQSQLFSVDWLHVATDSGAGVLILDSQGRVLFINAVAARIYGRRSAREATNTRLADLMPQAAAAERAEITRHVIASGETIQARELWGGWAMRWTIRSVANSADAANPGALIVCSQESALPEDFGEPAARVIEFKHVDYGQLTGLTPSELKVMALIGEGMSNADIAAKLHRAVKTVESHRAALTEKTGNSSRVQLGIMARRAGLLRRVALNDHEPTSPKVGV